MKKCFMFFIIIYFSAPSFAQSVSVNTTPLTPDRRNIFGERLILAVDRYGLNSINSGDVPQKGYLELGLNFSVAQHPLAVGLRNNLNQVSFGFLLEKRTQLNLNLSYVLAKDFQVYLKLPYIANQQRSANVPTITPRMNHFASEIDRNGLGDVHFGGRYQLLQDIPDDVDHQTKQLFESSDASTVRDSINSESNNIDLSIGLLATLPTASPQTQYMGERNYTLYPELNVSKWIEGNFQFLGSLGAKFRRGLDMTEFLLEMNDELVFQAGTRLALNRKKLSPIGVGLSLYGFTPLEKPFAQKFSTSAANGLEALLSFNMHVQKTFDLELGVSREIASGYLIPESRLYFGVRYTPDFNYKDGSFNAVERKPCPYVYKGPDGKRYCSEFEMIPPPKETEQAPTGIVAGGVPTISQDTDGDGIADEKDQCVGVKEDFDGFQDTDGCPDLDNDQDGVPDTVDKCPIQPGSPQAEGCLVEVADNDGDGVNNNDDLCLNLAGTVENKGCPNVGKLKVVNCNITLSDKIYFAVNKGKIRFISFPILDELAETLINNPQLNVEIQGHTDSDGGIQYNQNLSFKRAQSVKYFLRRKGVDASRLTARGYGEDKPIVPNTSKDNKAQNRRVVIKVQGCE